MRANHLPGAQQKRLWEKKWVIEAVSILPPAFLAGAATVKASHDPKFDVWAFWLSLCACGWLVLVGIHKAMMAKAEDAKSSPEAAHEGLYAAVLTVHSMLSEHCNKRGYGRDIRATFHRVVPPIEGPSEIEQIINYAGGGGEGIGRKFSVHTGITGRAIRNMAPMVMSNEAGTSEEQLRAALVDGWGYTGANVRTLSPARFSAIALPVLDRSGQHVIGVIYFDSSDHALFDLTEVEEIVFAGARAISDFVTKRY